MKRARRTIRRIALGLAVAAIAPATAQANPIDMTGEDFRYVHDQAVAAAKERAAAADSRKAVSQQRPRRPRIYDSTPARG
jgi:hypothetical protein